MQYWYAVIERKGNFHFKDKCYSKSLISQHDIACLQATEDQWEDLCVCCGIIEFQSNYSSVCYGFYITSKTIGTNRKTVNSLMFAGIDVCVFEAKTCSWD